MVLIKHNYLKSDIFFNSIFIPGFSESRFFRVQVFRVRVQGPGYRSSPCETINYNISKKDPFIVRTRWSGGL